MTDKEESNNTEESSDAPPMAPLENDEEEIKQLKEVKILTRNKLLTRLPI